jgi:tetraacyldisaccharide-1-P 4'-kinase
MGVTVLELLRFPDHHRFTGGDLRRIRDRFERSGAAMLLTTEKDAVRLSAQQENSCLDSLPLYCIRIKAEIVEGETALRSVLDSVLRGAGVHVTA